MKGNMKQLLIGAGVIFGLQLVLALLVKFYVEALSNTRGATLAAGDILLVGVSLGTFFVGGLIMGFMAERISLGVPVVAGALAMFFTTMVLNRLGLPDSTFLIDFAGNDDWVSFSTIVAGGIVAVTIGAIVGERFRTPVSDDALARWVLVAALAFVLTGPFYFLIPFGLPWYIAVIASLMILVLVGVGYYLFTEGSTFEKSIDEISINPERQP